MSKKNKKISISQLLRQIADNIERFPRFVHDLQNFVVNYSPVEPSIDKPVDIWELYGKGPDKFEKSLDELSVRQLITVIQKNNFDSTKLSHKWKNHDKLKELIISRMNDRGNKGHSFLDATKQEDTLRKIGTITLTKSKPTDTFTFKIPPVVKKIHLKASSTPYSITVWTPRGEGETQAVTNKECDVEEIIVSEIVFSCVTQVAPITIEIFAA